MTTEAEDAKKRILEIMLALPWSEREDVWRAVEHNGVFCVHCGWGSIDEPNPHCQCQNDE